MRSFPNFPEISRNFARTSGGVTREICRIPPHLPQSFGRTEMSALPRCLFIAIAFFGVAQPACADVIVDWNEKAVAFVVGHSMLPPPAERVLAMTQLAMFDAVNSIERKYRPYLVQLPAAPTISKEAAAAAAAATVLGGIDPQAQNDVKATLVAYLAAIPDSEAKSEGIKLGE